MAPWGKPDTAGSSIGKKPWIKWIKAVAAWILVLGLGWLVPPPSPVYAADLQMDIHIGFNGRFLLNTWTPLTVLIHNQGPAIKGELEVVTASGSEYRNDVRATTYAATVELPSRSSKQFAFTVHLDNSLHPLQIRLAEQGRKVLTRSLNLKPHLGDTPLLLVLGSGPAVDLTDLTGRSRDPVWPQPDLLPQRWYGYQAVAAVIMDSARMVELLPACFEALAQWIARGGLLIITAGPDSGTLQDPRVQRLMPLQVLGLRRTQAGNDLAIRLGHEQEPWPDLPVVHVAASDAAVMAADQDVPLLLERGLGSGKVVFTAFDALGPPFAFWAGRDRFWQMVLDPGPSQHFAAQPAMEKEVLDALAQSHPSGFASPAKALVFGLIYFLFCLAMHQYLVRRKQRRMLGLAAWLLGLVLIGLAGVWMSAVRSGGRDPYLSGFERLYLTGASQPSPVVAYLGVFAMQPGVYSWTPGTAFQPVLSVGELPVRDLPADAMRLREAPERQIVSVDLQGWSHRFFKIHDHVTVPIEIAVSGQGAQRRITIHNRSRYSLEHVQVLEAGVVQEWGRIAAGATALKIFGAGRTADSEIPERPAARPANRAGLGLSLMEKLQRRLGGLARDLSRQDAGRMRVCGWIDSGLLSFSWENQRATGQAAAFFEWLAPQEH